MPPESILDLEAIENLRSLSDVEGDDSFLREVIEIFLSDTPLRLQEMHSAHAANDQEAFTRAAHSIKGSSSNVGAARLGELAKHLEIDAKASMAGMDQRIAALEAAFAETKAALEAL